MLCTHTQTTDSLYKTQSAISVRKNDSKSRFMRTRDDHSKQKNTTKQLQFTYSPLGSRHTPHAKHAGECLCGRIRQRRDAVRKKIPLVVDAGKADLRHFSRGDLALYRFEGSKFARGVIPILQDV